eukprot:UN07447
MLAEALFEVLDEIHQQSAALSSKVIITSNWIRSCSKGDRESLPVKVYRKPLKTPKLMRLHNDR